MTRMNRLLLGCAMIISLALIPLASVEEVRGGFHAAATVNVSRVYLPLVLRPPAPPPKPTPVPPTPTPEPPPGVNILANHSHYVTDYGYLHLFGEVHNSTVGHIGSVKVAVNFFDAQGRLVATNYTYTALFDLPAQEKACFHVVLEEPAGWAYYEFENPTYFAGGQPLPNLAVINDSWSYNPTWGDYQIIGQVRNDHSTRVNFVRPVGTLYDANNAVVGCAATYVHSTDLDPGQVSAFSMIFMSSPATARSYRLQVGGTPE